MGKKRQDLRRQQQTHASYILIALVLAIFLIVAYKGGTVPSTGESHYQRYLRQMQAPNTFQPYRAYPSAGGIINSGSACDDKMDNDGDSFSDWPSDPGCTGRKDTSEKDPKLPCDDGEDNDNDGLTDYPGDSGCRRPDDMLEHGGKVRTASGCTDSDGGVNPELKGTVSVTLRTMSAPATDRCIDNYQLYEYSCENGQTAYELIKCPTGICRDGACQSELKYEGYRSSRRITYS